MIRPEDADLHPADPSITNWTETIGFWFAVPEEHIYGNIYLLARPNVGATTASVNVVQGLNRYPFTVDMTDPHMHCPCPDSMLDFTLPSGLSVQVTKAPTDYHFRYENLAGTCSFDMQLVGAMPAWDPHDPDENPLLAKKDGADLGLGDAWSGGHLDFIGRVRGELTLRGRTYQIDSMGGMDRSWSPRSELGQSAISYLHVPFGEDLGIHLVTGLDLDRGETVYGPLRFGYVHRGTEVSGITAVKMSGEQQGLQPMSNDLEVTDETGEVFRLRGNAVAGAPWYSFSPSYVTFQSLMHYELDGRHAYGLMSDVYGLEFLAERTSRHGSLTTQAFGPGI